MSPAEPSASPAPGSITFIGGGNMARSLIGGLLTRGREPASIHVSEPHAQFRDALARDFSVQVHADNAAAAALGATWVFAVKPQVMRSVAEALAPIAQRQQPLLVSIAAGITSSQLERWLGGNLPVIRTMPNTPALLGAGATGLFANARVDAAQRASADALLGATGLTVWIDDEAQMDIVTALSGSGPAYVFLLAEAMQAAAEEQGLPAVAARALALQTIHGAARMLVESADAPSALRQKVTSPGGTTQAAIESLESDGVRAMFSRAIAAATRRGAELSAANELPAP